ncbi:hypothetical protein HanHA300_Chr08g0283041 [Helianthus annuus]|nr:hypothetical protein HanHA300_Chr08g0283041 [Helianthus annuus]KAJ0553798.1 hypothetical protein HanHA89_Chr08g0300441 [Helianthus annuus]KAJ0719458.1 hypothetical protein HanLR1_Chr08g0281981 [Helianthus annuus]KAJ0722685.1 hypothetical protein HanOQP8_Chr08g0289461 [Helianthus annuus]
MLFIAKLNYKAGGCGGRHPCHLINNSVGGAPPSIPTDLRGGAMVVSPTW